MKKNLVILFGALLIMQGSLTYGAATDVAGGIFSSLKNAIIKDVKDTVTSTVSSTANRALNQIKLVQLREQLTQKKQELADLEASKTNFIVKFFKRRKLNNEIKDIESQIASLEAALKN